MEKQVRKISKPWLLGAVISAAAVVVLSVAAAVLFLNPGGDTADQPQAQAYTLYWNVDGRQYAEDSEKTRPVNADKTCTMRFACEGEIVELQVENRRLASTLDAVYQVDGHGLMGLVFNDSGVVIDFVRLMDMPLTVNGRLFYIQTLAGKKVKLNSTKNFIGMEEIVECTEETKLYDMTGVSGPVGSPTVLQEGDQVLAISNQLGVLTHVFVVGRDGMLEEQAAFCQHCKQDVIWKSWVKADELPIASGHFYLTKDVELLKQQQVQESAQLCVDLNGYTVTGTKNQRIYVNYNPGCTLSIMDNSEAQSGKLVAEASGKASSGYCVWIRYGQFNLYSGTLDGSNVSTAVNGAAVKVASSTMFSMYGGTIIGGTTLINSEKQYGYGGSVDVAGTFNMYGGTITGGTAKTGGGNVVISGSGVFTMYDGEIINGLADGGTGGNIYVGNNGTFVLNGGEIRDGVGRRNAKNGNGGGGNVYVKGYMEMTGGLITGGVCQANNGSRIKDANGCNLYIYKKAKLSGGTITGSVRAFGTDKISSELTLSGDITIDGAPKGLANLHIAKTVLIKVEQMTGGRIGVTCANGGGIFTEPTDSSNAKYFFSDEGSSVIAYGGCLAVGRMGCKCSAYGAEVHKYGCNGESQFWMPYGNAVGKTDGYYYLTKNISKKQTIKSNSCIDLNGYRISCTDDRALDIGGNVTIINSRPEAENGGIIVGNAQNQRGGTAIVNENSSLTLCDGVTLKVAESAKPTSGGVIDTKGTVNLWGGNIVGTKNITGNGGAIRLYGGTLNAVAGKISAGDVYSQKGSVSVSGTVYIGGLTLNGTIITLGEGGLTEGANVRVRASMGQQILARDNMDDAAWEQVRTYVEKGYISSVDQALKVVWEADGVYLRAVNTVIHCLCGDKTATGNPCADAGHPDLEWGPWDGSFALSGGNYYLSGDVASQIEIKENENKDVVINIDLAGHNWTAKDGQVLNLFGETVNFTNTKKSGSVVTGMAGGKRGGTVCINGGEVGLYGNVTFRNAAETAPTYGGVFEVRGKLSIYGGTIEGTTVTHDSGGGAICVTGGQLHLYGGKIVGGKAPIGSAVTVTNRGEQWGQLHLHGGTIASGEVYVKAGCPVTAYDNAPTVEKGFFQLRAKEACKLITRDESVTDAQWENYLTLLVNNKIRCRDEGVTLSHKADGIYAAAAGGAEEPDDAVVHCRCGDPLEQENDCAEEGHQQLQWEPYNGIGNLEPGKNYYLTTHVNKDIQTELTSGHVNLDLAGYNWTGTETAAFYLKGGSLSVCNTGAQEAVISGSNSAKRGGSFVVDGGALTLYKNVKVQTAEGVEPTYGGAAEVRDTLHIYGATIEGCKVTDSAKGGGAICVNGGKLYLHSGTITAGRAGIGSAVSVIANGTKNGQLHLYGGTVDGGEVYIKAGCEVTAYATAVTLKNVTMQLRAVGEGKIIARDAQMADAQWQLYLDMVAEGKLTTKDTDYVIKGEDDGIYAVAVNNGGDPGEEPGEGGTENPGQTPEDTPVVHCLCGDPTAQGNPCADAGHQQLTWVLWDGVAALEDGKSYYLNKSVEASVRLETGSINLDLAGYDLTAPAGSRALYLTGGSINITNTGKDDQNQPKGGLVSGSSAERGGTICVHAATSDLVLYSNVTVATLDGTEGSYGGAIEVRGNLYIYGATIQGSTVTGNEGGGAICIKGGNVSLYSGTVIGGTANIGSAVTVNSNGSLYGNLYLNGGTVKDGEVYVKAGCHVYVADTATVLDNATMELRVNEAGKIIVRAADMPDEQWASYSQYLNAGAIYTPDTDYALEATAEGIYGKAVAPVVQEVIHCVCGDPASVGNPCAEAGHQQLTWTAWDQAWNEDTTLAAGNYYLTQDAVIRQKAIGNAVVNLDMAGFSLTANYKNVFLMNDGGVLNVCNTGKDAQDQPKGGWIKGITDAGRGGSICITHANAVVNLYENITVRTENGYTPTYGGAIEVRGTLNMYGATVIGCRVTDATKGGGAICVNGGNLNVYSGRIVGADAPVGDAVSLVNGTITLYGGTIEQGDLYLASGKKIVLGNGWTGNAQIPITVTMASGTGIFATAESGMTLTEAMTACFASSAGKQVALDGNTIVLQ